LGRWNFYDGLDFEGVYGNTALGNYESKEVPCSDAEHALEGVQIDVVLMTPLEDDPSIIKMLGVFSGSSCEVIQVCKDEMSQIMKNVCHSSLESCASIF
jgi:hypothetical protein